MSRYCRCHCRGSCISVNHNATVFPVSAPGSVIFFHIVLLAVVDLSVYYPFYFLLIFFPFSFATPIINIESFLFNHLTFLFVVILVPSAAPQTVEVKPFSSTSLNVSWSYVPLEHRNGEITGYEVVLDDEATKTSENIMIKNPNELFFKKDGLKKYHKYKIRVAAITSVGRGVYSSWVETKTFEDGKMKKVFV